MTIKERKYRIASLIKDLVGTMRSKNYSIADMNIKGWATAHEKIDDENFKRIEQYAKDYHAYGHILTKIFNELAGIIGDDFRDYFYGLPNEIFEYKFKNFVDKYDYTINQLIGLCQEYDYDYFEYDLYKLINNIQYLVDRPTIEIRNNIPDFAAFTAFLGNVIKTIDDGIAEYENAHPYVNDGAEEDDKGRIPKPSKEVLQKAFEAIYQDNWHGGIFIIIRDGKMTKVHFAKNPNYHEDKATNENDPLVDKNGKPTCFNGKYKGTDDDRNNWYSDDQVHWYQEIKEEEPEVTSDEEVTCEDHNQETNDPMYSVPMEYFIGEVINWIIRLDGTNPITKSPVHYNALMEIIKALYEYYIPKCTKVLQNDYYLQMTKSGFRQSLNDLIFNNKDTKDLFTALNISHVEAIASVTPQDRYNDTEPKISFCSRYGGPDWEHNFIDLDALVQNIIHSLPHCNP